ncbi:MAG: 50S ribosomal protein L22 [Nanoarchaeota archaeon]|nr:50S ribosomal protein L22 [Nanoarchaeota archaeon]MBU1704087.1 50S ribosomal protein L22 [Nanoarchaeota archaeon]
MTTGYNKEHMARVYGRSLSISNKFSIEIANYIRNKKLSWAKQQLEKIIKKETPLPLTRFHGDRGHKKGMAAGAYPIKASQEILSLLNSVEANAQFLGLNTSNLIIKTIIATQGPGQWHYGRQRRRRMKRTNIEIIVEETAKKSEDKKKPEIKHDQKKMPEAKKIEKTEDKK